MTDYKLGKLPPDPQKPKLQIGRFLAAAAPESPPVSDWMSEIRDWPLHRNDEVGDCTIVSQSHALLALSHYGNGNEKNVTDDDVIRAYSEVSGYDPKTGAKDNGALVQDALNHWRKTGLGGHKILAFAQVNVHDMAEVEAAIHTFGTLILGVALPTSAQNQTGRGRVWDVVSDARTSEPYSWGGHAVATGLYDRNAKRLRVSTWGSVQDLTDAFWRKYVDEAWIVITEEWADANGLTPGGVNLHALGEDFAAMTGEPNPFPEPEPEVDPVPAPTPVVEPTVPDEDVELAAAARDWLRIKRRAGNKQVADALQRWLDAHGL